MENFQKNQEKLINNHIKLTNRTPFEKFNPPYQDILDLSLSPLCILMGYMLKFQIKVVYLSLKVTFVFANSVASLWVALHLGLHCFQRTHLGVTSIQRVNK